MPDEATLAEWADIDRQTDRLRGVLASLQQMATDLEQGTFPDDENIARGLWALEDGRHNGCISFEHEKQVLNTIKKSMYAVPLVRADGTDGGPGGLCTLHADDFSTEEIEMLHLAIRRSSMGL